MVAESAEKPVGFYLISIRKRLEEIAARVPFGERSAMLCWDGGATDMKSLPAAGRATRFDGSS